MPDSHQIPKYKNHIILGNVREYEEKTIASLSGVPFPQVKW